MKKNLSSLIIIAWLLWLNACSIDLAKIEYGSDICHHCKMTIVDRAHSAEFINNKGKVFKFDAIECMALFALETDMEPGQLLVSNYLSPGELIPAENSSLLICQSIPSPMGAFLSAFETNSEMEEIRKEHGGLPFSWHSLLKEVSTRGWPKEIAP